MFKQGALAAHLTRTPNGVEFRYTSDWLANSGPPVATTLPVSAEPVTRPGGALPTYFAGLLPEGRRLTALRRSVKSSADDELTLVLAVGTDAVGDVQVLPDGHTPQRTSARLEVEDFTTLRFQDLLADLEIRVDRVGLPGVQDKVSLTMLKPPVATANHKYLLKLNPPEFPQIVENEHFFISAARASGLETVTAHLVHDASQAPGLVVQRFDRAATTQKESLLAVEDGCQVLDLHPEAKYRVNTETLLAKLSALCEAPLPAASTYLSQITYAYVTGNGDAHAKNFSILQDHTGRWAPAPAYDLPSSQPYGDHTLAMSIAGQRDGNLPGDRFVSLGVELGLPERAARRTVTDIAGRIDAWIDDLEQLPFDNGRINKLKKVVRHRQQMLTRGY